MPRAVSPVSKVAYSSIENCNERAQPAKKGQLTGSRSSFVWWLEVNCCVLAIGGLVGIAATVGSLDNRPLPNWPYYLSINTFIAGFSVLVKASVGLVLAEGISHIKWTNLRRPRTLHSFEIHDKASRGPWGSVILLWNDLGRSVSSLGALVTILILFLEPFSQQIVSFVDCEKIRGREIASVPRTNFYDSGGNFTRGDTNNVPWTLRNSVGQGIYATHKPQVDFECGTGNCTFSQQYSSLGFCHACQDVTSKLVNDPPQVKCSGPKDCEDISEYSVYPRVTLPPQTPPGRTFMNLTLDLGDGRVSMEEIRHTLVARGYPTIDIIRALDWQVPTFAAYRCEILPCVKTYSSSIVKSLIDERLESEYIIPESDEYYRVADLKCMNTSQRQQLQDLGYHIKADQRWLPYNVTISQNETSKALTFEGSCKYLPEDYVGRYCEESRRSMYNSSEFALKEEYAKLVPADCVYTMTKQAGTSWSMNFFQTLFNGTLTEMSLHDPPAQFGPETLMAIWHAGSGKGTLEDFSGLIKNVSDALTTHARQHGDPYQSNPVLGEVHQSTVCIRVKWPWIAYSSCVVGLTLLFFGWVVLQARHEQAQLRKTWEGEGHAVPLHDFKSSTLATLFHGLDGSSQQALADIGVSSKQEDLAVASKNTQVQMIATGQGWKLSATKS